MCDRSTPEERNISRQQSSWFATLQNEYQNFFAKNQAILNNLTDALQPIISAGPEHFAFTPAEEAAYRTQIKEAATREYRQAAQAVAERTATAGGGNVFLPSGASEQIQAELAQRALEKEAAEQLGVTQRGYDIGRQEFFQAIPLMERAPAEIEAPLAEMGRVTTTAGSDAFKSAQTIASQKGSWLGLVGGLAGTALGGLFGGTKGAQTGYEVGSSIGGPQPQPPPITSDLSP